MHGSSWCRVINDDVMFGLCVLCAVTFCEVLSMSHAVSQQYTLNMLMVMSVDDHEHCCVRVMTKD